jgi:hypothetical protein
VVLQEIGRVADPVRLPAQPRAGLVLESVLDEMAIDPVLWRGQKEARPIDVPALLAAPDAPIPTDPSPDHDGPDESGGVLARLAVTLLAAGFWGDRARFPELTNRRTGRAIPTRNPRFSGAKRGG